MPSAQQTALLFVWTLLWRAGGIRLGFDPSSLRSIRAATVLKFIPRCGPVKLLRGLSASSLSRFACSQRLASLRFGTKPGGFAHLGFIPHFAPSSLLTTAQRFLDVTLRLLTTPGFPPTRDTNRPAMPSLVCIPRFGPSGLFATAQRFAVVTLRLFATAGFPPTRDTNRPAMPSLVCIPRFGPSGLFATAQRFLGNLCFVPSGSTR